ncbi:MAG TPA: PDZ domain-containing protein [Candidatus Saccharimonadales bacterium]|nr:PDZ domain-containing protein [Candidatus Saccharimonadales bacterium]
MKATHAVLAIAIFVTLPSGALRADETSQNAEAEKNTRLSEEVRQRVELEKQIRLAKREYEAASRKLAELSAKLAAQPPLDSRRAYRIEIRGERRARLGIVVQTRDTGDADPNGATIVAITPGSAAEDAGLHPGDVVYSMDGESLAGASGDGGMPGLPPALKLIRKAGDLEPGQKVKLEYRRGGAMNTITLEARPIDHDRDFVWVTPFAAGQDSPPGSSPDLSTSFSYSLPPEMNLDFSGLDDQMVSRWMDLEMVALGPELGKYFGATKGVLVVHVPDKDVLQVRPGDVILRIGDEKPTAPWQVLRTLRTLRPGEPVDLHLLRDRSVVTVRAQAPALQGPFGMVPPPQMPEPPETPEPPPKKRER